MCSSHSSQLAARTYDVDAGPQQNRPSQSQYEAKA